jgi:hypothetical protein
MKRTSGTLLLVALLGGCSAFDQEPEPKRIGVRVASVPAPSKPTWAGPNSGNSSYTVEDGTRTRAPGESASVPPNRPTSVTSVAAMVNTSDQDTTGGSSSSTESPPKAHLEGPARPDAPMIIHGKDMPRDPLTPNKTESAANKPELPSLTPVPLGTQKNGSNPPIPSPGVLPPPPGNTAAMPSDNATVAKDVPLKDVPLKDTPVKEKSKQAAGAMVRVVNNKHVTLNFKVEDVGPSGVSAIEVWSTQDCKEWKKNEVPPQSHAFVFDAEEEGIYGFTMVARSGIGLGKEPPVSGDLPQVWVLVDTTKPVVQLTDCTATFANKTHTVNIQWKATDKNLGTQPINIFYAEKEDGPWTPIATRIENSGNYVWKPAAGSTPAKLIIRVEATDLAGNIGTAQTAKHVLLDTSIPKIDIVNVEAGRE